MQANTRVRLCATQSSLIPTRPHQPAHGPGAPQAGQQRSSQATSSRPFAELPQEAAAEAPGSPAALPQPVTRGAGGRRVSIDYIFIGHITCMPACGEQSPSRDLQLRVYAHSQTHTSRHRHAHACTHADTQIQTSTHSQSCTNTYGHKHRQAHTHVHTHTDIRTKTSTHTYKCTYTYRHKNK